MKTSNLMNRVLNRFYNIFTAYPLSIVIIMLLTIFVANNTIATNTQAQIICVDVHAKVIKKGDGSCWQNPFNHLEDALTVARRNNNIKEIWIAKGVYKPSRTYAPKNTNGIEIIGGAFSLPENNPGVDVYGNVIAYQENPNLFNYYLKTFELVDGVNIYGGFQGQSHPQGGEKNKSQRGNDPNQFKTILEGNLNGNPFNVNNRVWHVVTAGSDITLSGVNVTLDRLVIRNGDATFGPYLPVNFPLLPDQTPIYYHDDGGGLYIFTHSNIVLHDITFENNAAVAGGAVYVHDGSTLTITNSHFINNTAFNGGAIEARSGGPNELTSPEARQTKLLIAKTNFNNNYAFIGDSIFTFDNQLIPPYYFASVLILPTVAYYGPPREG